MSTVTYVFYCNISCNIWNQVPSTIFDHQVMPTYISTATGAHLSHPLSPVQVDYKFHRKLQSYNVATFFGQFQTSTVIQSPSPNVDASISTGCSQSALITTIRTRLYNYSYYTIQFTCRVSKNFSSDPVSGTQESRKSNKDRFTRKQIDKCGKQ